MPARVGFHTSNIAFETAYREAESRANPDTDSNVSYRQPIRKVDAGSKSLFKQSKNT